MENIRKIMKEFTPDQSEKYAIDNWNEYNLTENKADFITLMINLKMHDETLDGLHCGDDCCGFVMASDAVDVVRGVLEHTFIFNSFADYIATCEECYKENPDYNSLYDYIMDIEIDNNDNLFMIYDGKVYKRIYC